MLHHTSCECSVLKLTKRFVHECLLTKLSSFSKTTVKSSQRTQCIRVSSSTILMISSTVASRFIPLPSSTCNPCQQTPLLPACSTIYVSDIWLSSTENWASAVTPGVVRVRPAGQIRPASSVHPARGGTSVLTLNSARKTYRTMSDCFHAQCDLAAHW